MLKFRLWKKSNGGMNLSCLSLCNSSHSGSTAPTSLRQEGNPVALYEFSI